MLTRCSLPQGARRALHGPIKMCACPPPSSATPIWNLRNEEMVVRNDEILGIPRCDWLVGACVAMRTKKTKRPLPEIALRFSNEGRFCQNLASFPSLGRHSRTNQIVVFRYMPITT